ncbi:MAG: hypothetical protein E6H02_07650 [Bacillati bacterium ANGP1]|uniref:Uncharacterized protein n=1 Tax=Candidatus Segetimicrobium genomatis TaxID=2569760 RepID=A0A537LSZ9_9BACT|nr:MAG: hypothetical protein E6H02_07650 [Terrabacteria group bacterium ANGP1]
MRQRAAFFGLIFLSFFLMGTPAARAGTAVFAPIDGIHGVAGALAADQSDGQSAPPAAGENDSDGNDDDSQGGSGCGG